MNNSRTGLGLGNMAGVLQDESQEAVEWECRQFESELKGSDGVTSKNTCHVIRLSYHHHRNGLYLVEELELKYLPEHTAFSHPASC